MDGPPESKSVADVILGPAVGADDPYDLPLPPLNEPEPAEQPIRLGLAVGRLLLEVFLVVLTALCLVILIKSFLLQAFYIPTPSMVPTLGINDRVLVSKASFLFDEPGQGDVIVFRDPTGAVAEENLIEKLGRNIAESVGLYTSNTQDLIKRVIAVGGDYVAIKNNQVYVNGVALDEPYLAPGFFMSDRPTVLIPPDHVWVMGDNRNNSQDSRRLGPIPVDNIVGRAFIRIWPPSRLAGL